MPATTPEIPDGPGSTGLPVVDVVIPAYGDGALLREAVDSVLGQDVPGWRLTVLDDRVDDRVDDGVDAAGVGVPADPGLGEYLRGLGDARVRYAANPVRLGINRNFQRSLDVAEGPLVVVLGADDRLLPHYVRTVAAAAARHPDAAWIHPGVRVIDAAGRPSAPLGDRVKARLAARVGAGRGERLAGGEPLAASLLQGNWMYFPSVAFRRETAVKYGFRPGFDVVLDLDLYLRMLLDGAQVVLLDEVCFEYRRHAASLSSTEKLDGARFAEERRYFAEAAAAARAAGWPRAARAARVHWTSRLHAALAVPAALRAGRPGLAGHLLRHAALPVRAGQSGTAYGSTTR